jgi:hypothetical protein
VQSWMENAQIWTENGQSWMENVQNDKKIRQKNGHEPHTNSGYRGQWLWQRVTGLTVHLCIFKNLLNS